MKLHRRQAFAGFLIVGLIALIGFAAFSATGFSKAPPLDLPESSSGRIAGQILGVDLGPDAADPTITESQPESPSTSPESSEAPATTSDASGTADTNGDGAILAGPLLAALTT